MPNSTKTRHPIRPHRQPFTAAVALATALVAALSLAGCSSSEADPNPTTNGTAETSALLPQAEGNTQYPLTLESPFGDTVLDERPERIAIVSAVTKDTDALIGIGGTPVLAPSTIDRNPWIDDSVKEEIETLWLSGSGMEVTAEEVAAATPDLIVSLAARETFDQGRFDQLSAIAPVLYAAAEDNDTWQELTTRFGEALDLSDTAAAKIAETEATIGAVKAANPQFQGKSLAFVQVFAEEYGPSYFNPPGSAAGELTLDLGFTFADAAKDFTGERAAISPELTPLIDADILLLSYVQETPHEYFTESPLFLEVPAVKEGRVAVYTPDPSLDSNPVAWGFAQPSVLSLPWLVDTVAELANTAIG